MVVPGDGAEGEGSRGDGGHVQSGGSGITSGAGARRGGTLQKKETVSNRVQAIEAHSDAIGVVAAC